MKPNKGFITVLMMVLISISLFRVPLSTPFLMSRMIHRSMKAYSISPNAASFVVKEMVDTYRMHLLPCASGQRCSAAHWATLIRSIMMMTVFGRATQMDGWR